MEKSMVPTLSRMLAMSTLHASLKKWRGRRNTIRALADLDEHQLRDIGLRRDDGRPDDSFRLRRRGGYRALADVDDIQQVAEGNNLSGETK